MRPEFVDVPSPESSERYPLRREPLSSNEAVPIVSFHYKGRPGIPIKGEVTNHNLMIFDGSEVLQFLFQWWNMRTHPGPRYTIRIHKKPTIRINGTCPKPKCETKRRENPGGFSARITSNESLFSGLSYRTSLDSETASCRLQGWDMFFWWCRSFANFDAGDVFGPEFLLMLMKSFWILRG